MCLFLLLCFLAFLFFFVFVLSFSCLILKKKNLFFLRIRWTWLRAHSPLALKGVYSWKYVLLHLFRRSSKRRFGSSSELVLGFFFCGGGNSNQVLRFPQYLEYLTVDQVLHLVSGLHMVFPEFTGVSHVSSIPTGAGFCPHVPSSEHRRGFSNLRF